MGGLGVNTHTLRKRAVHPQRTSKAAANFSLLFFEKIDRLRLRLVRVKVFPENILFSGNAIFRKGKCFHVFGCISKNFLENIF